MSLQGLSSLSNFLGPHPVTFKRSDSSPEALLFYSVAYCLLKMISSISWDPSRAFFSESLQKYPSLLQFVKRMEDMYPQLKELSHEDSPIVSPDNGDSSSFIKTLVKDAMKEFKSFTEPETKQAQEMGEEIKSTQGTTSLMAGLTVGSIILVSYMTLTGLIRIQ